MTNRSKTIPDQTKQVSLYRMVAGHDLDSYWFVREEAEQSNYTSLPVAEFGDEAILVFGEKDRKRREWVSMILALTGHDLEYENAEPSAILLVRRASITYAATFGGGWRMLRGGLIDRAFGLDFALRVVDSEEVRHLKRQYFSANSRVDINAIPGGQQLWALGVREHAELVRQLTGKVEAKSSLDLSHIRKVAEKRSTRISIDGADRIRVPLPYSRSHFLDDLDEIARIFSEVEISSDLQPLRWIRQIEHGEEELLDQAWSLLIEDFQDHGEAVSLAYPSHYHGGPEIGSFRGEVGHVKIDGPDLELRLLRESVMGHDKESSLRILKSGRIEGYDESGVSLAGDESAVNWLAGQVDTDSGKRLVLLDGDWYDLTDSYRHHVRRLIQDVFDHTPPWVLPAWKSAPTNEDNGYDEKNYNLHAGSFDGFLCLDRKLVRTRMHPRGFEACDLLGPNNELIHVKKTGVQSGSGPLSHLFAQGTVAADSLTEIETWSKFVDVVRKQDPMRAESLGKRPHSIVYAIHRADGTVSPDNLFTFAQAQLATAVLLLGRLGIPVWIYEIPT